MSASESIDRSVSRLNQSNRILIGSSGLLVVSVVAFAILQRVLPQNLKDLKNLLKPSVLPCMIGAGTSLIVVGAAVAASRVFNQRILRHLVATSKGKEEEELFISSDSNSVSSGASGSNSAPNPESKEYAEAGTQTDQESASPVATAEACSPDSVSGEEPATASTPDTNTAHTPEPTEATAVAGPPDPVSGQEAAQPEKTILAQIQEDIIPPIFDAIGGTILSIVKVHARANGKKEPSDEEINNWTAKCKDLFNTSIQDPRLLAAEILRFFGRGKMKLSVAKRRVLAAYNSGDKKLYKQTKTRYNAVMGGNDAQKLKKFLDKNTNKVALLNNFPAYFAKHFTLINKDVKELGQEILKTIFADAIEIEGIDQAIKHLRKKPSIEAAEEFVRFVFERAKLDETTLENWKERIEKEIIAPQLANGLSNMMNVLARNLRLLPTLFQEKINKKTLYPHIQTTFLLSESIDLKADEKRLSLQSAVNYGRKNDQKFTLVKEDKDTGLILCFAPDEQKKLRKKYNVPENILFVPTAINDHPFIETRKKLPENKLGRKLVEGMFSLFEKSMPSYLEPYLSKALPKMLDEGLQTKLGSVVDIALKNLLRPIFDGSISRSNPFREHFEKIISTKAPQLAQELDHLHQTTDLETLKTACIEAFKELTDEFNKVAC